MSGGSLLLLNKCVWGPSTSGPLFVAVLCLWVPK